MSVSTRLQRLGLHENARTISPFEALPAELRHEILRYVLHTKQARLAKPQRVTYPGQDKILKSRSFDWHVQVLQVCRTLYNDGKDITYRENQWVKVYAQLRPDRLFDSMTSQDVPFIKHVAGMRMTDHVMSVTIRWVPATTELQVPITVFLLPAEEVSNLCRYLLKLKYTSVALFEFIIDVPAKHTKSMQRRLVLPFAMLKEDLVVQNVQIRGQIQESLVNKVKLAMTQEVGWARGRLWSIHDCIYSFSKLVDQAFMEHDFAVAATKYGEILDMWTHNHQYRPDIELNDKDLCKAQLRMDMAVHTNNWICQMALGRANHGMVPPTAMHVTQMLDRSVMDMAAPRWLRCKYAHVMSIGFLHVGNPVEAFKLIHGHAMKGCLPEDADIFNQTLAFATGYRKYSTEERREKLTFIMMVLTSKPVEMDQAEPYVCDVSASEKHVCRELGFNSDFSTAGLAMVRDGITIRVNTNGHSRVLAEIPLQGKDSFTASDIDVMEALLRSRLQTEPAYRDDRYPKLYQVGHVQPEKLAGYIHRMRQSTPRLCDVPYPDHSGRLISRDGLGQVVKWVHLKYDEVGQRSVSDSMDEVESLIKTMEMRPLHLKKKMEKAVDKMVMVYKERKWIE